MAPYEGALIKAPLLRSSGGRLCGALFFLYSVFLFLFWAGSALWGPLSRAL